MTSIQNRILKVGLTIRGKEKIFSQPLFIKASGHKYGSAQQNDALVSIGNLSATDLDYVLTTYSIWKQGTAKGQLTVYAGREGVAGLSVVFTGVIVQSSPSQPPDVMATFKCLEGYYASLTPVSATSGPQTQLSAIAAGVAKGLGYPLIFEADDRPVSNWSVSGTQEAQIKALNDVGVNAYVDNGVLFVKNNAQTPLRGITRVLSETSGMIGIPEITLMGVKVKYLFDASSRLGGSLKIESRRYPAANGIYTIYELEFALTTRENDWYWIASCTRAGFK